MVVIFKILLAVDVPKFLTVCLRCAQEIFKFKGPVNHLGI